MMEMTDITPHVNLLRSFRGERVDYALVAGEGIDNAFDAGAKTVAVKINSDEICFQDDGSGVTRNNVRALFSIGEHGAMTTTQLGRFGIGIKSQAINAGDVFEIDSISRDGRLRASVNWKKLLLSGSWKIHAPSWLPALVGSPTGTIISISELRKPPQLAIEKMIDDIAQRFYPAIAGGQNIFFNDVRIEVLREPKMVDIVDRRFELSNGRGASLRAGILKEPSKLKGVHVAYKHRVIMPASPLGCREYSGLNKMFARVQLDGPWHLARFKNDLPDDTEREELEQAIHEALLPILKKCSSDALSARVAHMLGLVNNHVPEELAPARPRQKTRFNRKGLKPKRKGFANEADEDDAGPTLTKRPRRDRLLITFDGELEQHGVGRFIAGRPHRVDLSKGHGYVHQLMMHRDERLASQSLYILAIALYEEGINEFKNELPLNGSFGERIAKTFGIQDEVIKVAKA
jgi:hypothetical protein